MVHIPRIISVDDHVVEPPDLWTSRLPAKYQDRCPRIERDTRPESAECARNGPNRVKIVTIGLRRRKN